MVKQTSALDQKASEAVTGLLNGSGVEIHDANVDLRHKRRTWRLSWLYRCVIKLLAGYQRMMGMQF